MSTSYSEAEATAIFEGMVGGPERGFRLMHIWQSAVRTASTARWQNPPVDGLVLFQRRAKREGYAPEAIEFYINHIQG